MTSREASAAANGRQVMPELAFELEEIFRTRMFSLPLDDHESAREVFLHLLDRGVPEDELAHVIQASTNSMTLWLCRTGLKKMVGEWIISWINKCYSQYLTSESSVRDRGRRAEDCQSCAKDNCLSPRGDDRTSRKSGEGGELGEDGGGSEKGGDGKGRGGTGGGGEGIHPARGRSLSRPEISSGSDEDSFLPFDLSTSSEELKHLQSSPNVQLHLMCKSFVSFLRRGSGIVVSLRKSPSGSLKEISLPKSSLKSTRNSYGRFNSFPPEWKWKHLKLKAELSKFRREKRDSGIVEDMESFLSDASQTVCLIGVPDVKHFETHLGCGSTEI